MAQRLAYSDAYQADIGPHVFPMRKFALIRDALLREGLAGPEDLLQPGPAGPDEVLRVHTDAYWEKVIGGFGPQDEALLEMPYSPALAEGFRRMSQGSILAARAALEYGFAANIGGGFHHAFPDHGEGFCMLHDVAIAIRHAQAHGLARRVAVIDTDVHQGNGTAIVFAGDESVFTFSIHQENNYPTPKPPSDLDVGLEDGAGGTEYLEALEQCVPAILDRHRPDLVAYIAGVDPFEEDQLGGLRLTREDMRRREELVLGAVCARGIPVFATLAGGYARNVQDTVALHKEMIAIGLALWSAEPGNSEDVE